MKGKYEYAIHSPFKYHTATPNFICGDTNLPGFTSLYSVTHDEAKAIVAAGTTTGYKGSVWSERLWIDIDSYEKADAVEQRLKELELDYISYDSGGRGAHFGVLRDNAPSHLLPAQDKTWVKSLFPEADLSIYSHLHLFRLPGTRHETSGRDKRLVHRQRGKSLILPPLERKEAYAPNRSSSDNVSSNSSVLHALE